jgi:hypothetical protein
MGLVNRGRGRRTEGGRGDIHHNHLSHVSATAPASPTRIQNQDLKRLTRAVSGGPASPTRIQIQNQDLTRLTRAGSGGGAVLSSVACGAAPSSVQNLSKYLDEVMGALSVSRQHRERSKVSGGGQAQFLHSGCPKQGIG